MQNKQRHFECEEKNKQMDATKPFKISFVMREQKKKT